MNEEKDVLQENKPKKLRPKMAFAILILAALFVAELYLMTNYPKDYLLLGITGLAILCSVYLVTDFAFKLRDENTSFGTDDLERIYKAEKVSYVTMKKGFLEIERTLDRIRELSEIPTEELIQAQKAVGRVTIQRNKENAIAVIDSTEKLNRHILGLDEKLDGILSAAQEPTAGLSDNISKTAEQIEFLEKAQDELKVEVLKLAADTAVRTDAIMERLAGLETTLEKLTAADPVTITDTDEITSSKEVPATGETAAFQEPETTEEADSFYELTDIEETADSEEAVTINETLHSEHTVKETESSDESTATGETVMPEEEVSSEETIISEETVSTEETAMPEEELSLGETIISEEAVSTKETAMPEEEALTEETPPSAEDSDTLFSESSAAADDSDTGPDKPDLSKEEPLDLNRTMTPEEIAALLAESDPEEPEPEKTSSIPDLSDPSHVMTPEEIAALLANM